ncbi:HlyD family secretion protein [Fulvivirga sediminis]|uniref:HlyD family efflux transporter periplasmic adaptor subunit n=1 Tax=Fulvivirga sediminis TaxID=2803949 RepID=A0A937F518_9BACT|nr:HlyD family efflux transporter periplasmic adaptor subunit [Fulvivirga sediminis]MBL3655895.1 HlyD family efflux transporter periplasmic adaptor subunit [Fulvivirga sediminis]
MLNISINSIRGKIDQTKYSALNLVENKVSGRVFLRIISYTLIAVVIIMFLPWTQNINSGGNVTALRPDQRPQTIHSIIAGRIEKWYVQEGDFVEKGDTILYISEIKDDYFDPQLLSRTQEQLKAKEMSVKSYMEKVKALDNQIDALATTSDLKMEQARNKLKQAHLKVQSDSIGYEASITNYNIAKEQYARQEQLYNDGLKSLTDLEKRKLTLQKAQADMISYENKLLSSKNDVINAKVELTSIRTKYKESIAKAESDKYSAMSSMYDAETTVSKLQNQYMNYSVRTGLYYITAPQNGYVTQAIQTGLGETIKEGASIVSIMPSDYTLAVEMYVRPIDLPLLEKGQPVRIQFDGWPAVVFSGWPNTSYGTYGGKVYAIDNFISPNGKYRVLVEPDPEDHDWPDAIRVGAGTRNMVLLKDVPIWYELWRQINGFPPDYYKANQSGAGTSDKSKK